jgi:hypothetical protein
MLIRCVKTRISNSNHSNRPAKHTYILGSNQLRSLSFAKIPQTESEARRTSLKIVRLILCMRVCEIYRGIILFFRNEFWEMGSYNSPKSYSTGCAHLGLQLRSGQKLCSCCLYKICMITKLRTSVVKIPCLYTIHR